MNQNWLHGVIFFSMLGLGLALVARPLPQRLAVVAFAILVLLVIGVFWPTFTLHVLNGGVLLAVGLVLLVWVAMFFARLRPGNWKLPTRPSAATPFAAATATSSQSTTTSRAAAKPAVMSSLAAGYGEAAKHAAEAKAKKKQAEQDADQAGGENHG